MSVQVAIAFTPHIDRGVLNRVTQQDLGPHAIIVSQDRTNPPPSINPPCQPRAPCIWRNRVDAKTTFSAGHLTDTLTIYSRGVPSMPARAQSDFNATTLGASHTPTAARLYEIPVPVGRPRHDRRYGHLTPERDAQGSG
jgi:hypothetical protein